MRQFIPALIALPLLVAFGVAEGRWTGRWVNDQVADQAAARLQDVPLSFGDWVGEEQLLDARQVAKAELAGHLMRTYTHKTSGATLSFLLVCGRPGPISVHTPDVCYGGMGYVMTGPAGLQALSPNGPTAFRLGRFQNLGAPIPEYLRILWAWSTDGRSWSAPDNPRLTFAAAPALYKLYVVRRVADLNEAAEADTGRDFLRQFLPIVERSLTRPN